jgi:hypothetical protein
VLFSACQLHLSLDARRSAKLHFAPPFGSSQVWGAGMATPVWSFLLDSAIGRGASTDPAHSTRQFRYETRKHARHWSESPPKGKKANGISGGLRVDGCGFGHISFCLTGINTKVARTNDKARRKAKKGIKEHIFTCSKTDLFILRRTVNHQYIFFPFFFFFFNFIIRMTAFIRLVARMYDILLFHRAPISPV